MSHFFSSPVGINSKYKIALFSFFFFQSDEPSDKCNNLTKSSLTQEEKDSILTLHNDLRRKVANGLESRGNPGPQYPAVSMPPLVSYTKLYNFFFHKHQRIIDFLLY